MRGTINESMKPTAKTMLPIRSEGSIIREPIIPMPSSINAMPDARITVSTMKRWRARCSGAYGVMDGSSRS